MQVQERTLESYSPHDAHVGRILAAAVVCGVCTTIGVAAPAQADSSQPMSASSEQMPASSAKGTFFEFHTLASWSRPPALSSRWRRKSSTGQRSGWCGGV